MGYCFYSIKNTPAVERKYTAMIDVTGQLGRYFGYPECCIKAYKQVKAKGGIRFTAEQMNPLVTKGTKFVPCPEHAKQVLAGTITLESLIENRICSLPFPHEPEMAVVDEYLKELQEGNELKYG